MSEEGDGLASVVVLIVLVGAVVGHARGVTVPVPAVPVAQVAAAQPLAQPPPMPALPVEPVTPASWAGALLARLGDPQSAENIRAIVAWERKEGGHWVDGARFNPLNTTQPMPGAGCLNSVCVRIYDSWDEGLRATWIVLHNGYYPGILAALANGTCAPCVANAVAATPWGTGWFAT